MKKVANEKIYKWKGMKDYEKIHKWKIYSFSERMLSRAVRDWDSPMPRGGLLFREILHEWKFSTNDYDDWWNWIRIYIREIIHECKFFLLSFVNFFTVENFFICEFFHNKKMIYFHCDFFHNENANTCENLHFESVCKLSHMNIYWSGEISSALCEILHKNTVILNL